MHDITFRLLKRQNEAKDYLERFFLWPRQWQDFSKTCRSVFAWQAFPFRKSALPLVPDTPGIYSFIVQPGIAAHPHCSFLMYVGMAERQTLRQRFQQYLGPEQGPRGRPHIIRMLSLYKRHLVFCCSPVPAGMTAESAEDSLLAAYLPPYCHDLPASVSQVISGIR